MKAGLLFVIIVLLLFLFYRDNSRKVALHNGVLKIYDKTCSLQIPVQPLKHESDLIDELMIERDYLKLPNNQEIVLESIDLTNVQHTIGIPYNELVTYIFDMHVKEFWQKSGVAIYEGKFYVAVFYKTKHELELLYPLDKTLAMAIKECKKPEWNAVKLPTPPKPKWDMRLIITEGLINKNI
ncbi:hypothetical protein [Nitratiruptor tergarcus]|uniref:Uncharacterized protein n=1 Tax=Nitratiruptor tergarcus DSM 16512 TaxID=1069081 RepID=A0A1W1WQG6_9BACT|nr:hypothetical protein [Nitratiruptor tergarcus]SMC08260.1 hypothetical protein SAMN05660197_0004 [Nitratiruptor tergarcus DSM 16512]SMC10160.1 hypothetical protein SAMN05660197_2000 [Nitratiruptor tergarcus DSM 16512]